MRENLIDRIQEKWGDLVFPKITSPTVERLRQREILILPERLTNPYYGSVEIEQSLREIAKKAPGIEKIWEITKDLPSLTDLIVEERESE